MQSAPCTMLHVRMSSVTVLLDGRSVPMLRLMKRGHAVEGLRLSQVFKRKGVTP